MNQLQKHTNICFARVSEDKMPLNQDFVVQNVVLKASSSVTVTCFFPFQSHLSADVGRSAATWWRSRWSRRFLSVSRRLRTETEEETEDGRMLRVSNNRRSASDPAWRKAASHGTGNVCDVFILSPEKVFLLIMNEFDDPFSRRLYHVELISWKMFRFRLSLFVCEALTEKNTDFILKCQIYSVVTLAWKFYFVNKKVTANTLAGRNGVGSTHSGVFVDLLIVHNVGGFVSSCLEKFRVTRSNIHSAKRFSKSKHSFVDRILQVWQVKIFLTIRSGYSVKRVDFNDCIFKCNQKMTKKRSARKQKKERYLKKCDLLLNHYFKIENCIDFFSNEPLFSILPC